jgi:anthranilate phosphoribosyltransferase
MDVREAIARVVARQDLGEAEIAQVFGQIMDGEATPAQIGGLLLALRMKGETAAELAGAAQAMRARALAFRCADPEGTVDTCGTGGDGVGTVNVSTAAAIVVAAAGVPVAKHGNRALSSKSGSADVLEALGVQVDAPVAVLERCLTEVGITFMFAPAFHAATRHAAGPRKELGTRTIFNLLGPLTNPAAVRNQVVGVFDPRFCAPMARALGLLGARRAFVVHGEGGVDEIAVRGVTRVATWTRAEGDAASGTVVEGVLVPGDFGLGETDPAGLAGGDARENAAILRALFAGDFRTGPRAAVRAAVVMTAGLSLCAVGAAQDPAEGACRAEAAIDRGAAASTLAAWVTLSRSALSPTPHP